MPFDIVDYVGGYERNTRRLVATRRARPDGDVGFSLELYRRDTVANRWEEALRIDAMPDDLHFHAFGLDGGVHEGALAAPNAGRPVLARAVVGFVQGEGCDWIGRVGYGPDLDGDASRAAEVISFLENHLDELGAR